MGTMRACVIVALLFIGVAAARRQKEDDYGKILSMSYKFYEGQMSGELPPWNQHLYSKGGWRKSAHLKDNYNGIDLVGGFYDAGDYLKISHPLGWGVSNLILSMVEFKQAYDDANVWATAVRNMKWATDWLIKAHVKASDNPRDNVFIGQLSGKNDHHYFGRPEHAYNERPIYVADSSTGGADLVGEFAAAYAAGAVLFKAEGQAAYANVLYKHAQQAFAFAEAHPNTWKVPPGVFQAYASYWPEGYIAHLAWASAWMCKYDADMCPTANKWFNNALAVNNLRYGLGYDWDSTLPGAAALMISMSQPSASAAKQYLEDYVLTKWENSGNKCPQPSYSTVCYTPKGLAYYSDWGTLRNTGNMMFMAALMGKYGNNKQAHICWARSQMRYITGTATGKSYLIGYGPDQPKRPHHRQSACSARYTEPCNPFNGGTCCAGESGVGVGGCCDESNFRNPHPAQIVLAGALVGGPDQSDNYPDIREDYQRSEVAFDYNAGFTGAAAGLAQFARSGGLGRCHGGSGGGGGGAPNPPSNPPPNTPPPNNGGGNGGGKTIPDWQKCGGIESNCPASSCGDGKWNGFSCKSGSVCKRQSEYFWMCTPGTRTLAAPAATPLAGGAAAAADQPAVPGVDLLEVSAPAAAPAGSPVQLAASLTRMGAPVSGAVVEFVVADSTGNGSATVQAVTDGEGIARAVLPVEAAGAAGSSSTVSAVTPDGKAMGAKGTVALSSAEVGITWQ
ncbi:hypothetical protein OEZ86_011893 [Tetradesmus obliquus]|nr:hypothetical protein OEZ86_011893 [Tetradesmus obliquus]